MLIRDKDHATGKITEAPTNAIEKIQRTRVSNEDEGENLNFEGKRDDLDDNMSISLALQNRVGKTPGRVWVSQ